MKRRGLKLDTKKHASNLEVVAQFLNDRRGVSRESLIQKNTKVASNSITMTNGSKIDIVDYPNQEFSLKWR